MPSGLKGYNIRLDGVKVNSTPVPEDQPFPLTGLASGTNYASRITISAVDNAGNESTPVTLASLSVAATTPAPTPVEEFLPLAKQSAIDAHVATSLKPNTLADGVIIGVISPEGDYFKAYGGDRTADSPLTLDDRMRYGSISKMYTSLRVCMAIDDGFLELSDTVADHLGADVCPNATRITIKMLLMNRSGLKDYLQQDAAVQQAYFLTPTATYDPKPYIKNTPAIFEPDDHNEYSNANWIVLGMILEKVDQEHGDSRDVRTMILEDVLEPLELTETEWPTGNYLTAPYARGWATNFAYATVQSLGFLSFLAPLFVPGVQLTPEVEWTAVSTTWAGAAGALGGTIHDLVKFGQAIAAGDLLTPEMKLLREETMGTYLTYTPTKEWEGPGWMGGGLGVIEWGRYLGWVGNLGGYLSTLFANPDNGTVVAVMMNHMQGPSIDLAYRICYTLDPTSTQAKTRIVRTDGFTVTPTFGDMRVLLYQAPGDEDGKTDIALKVPFRT